MTALERIKQDLVTYFQKNNILDVEQGIKHLHGLLTPNILEANNLKEDSPHIVIAWTALQIQEGTPYRYHKSDELGEFIYNNEMYSLRCDTDGKYDLEYNDSYQGEMELPVGCTSTKYMFYGCKLPDGVTLGDKFNTSKITDMTYMFKDCKLPEGFSLGDDWLIPNGRDTKDV